MSESSVSYLCELVHESCSWDTTGVVWPNAKALLAATPSASAFLIHVPDDDGAPLVQALASRPGQTPLIVIGGTPPSHATVSLWLPQLPPVSLLGAALAHLVPAGDEARPAWRRKADMIIGNSKPVRDLLHALDQLASASTPVIITGESGVGKELVARSLHYCGARAKGPFIAINCAAIPETLFEAELFGHERGAFTGAVGARTGAFEAAHDGTLFLDEIGDMPLAMQAKLLRVLETSEVQRVGATEPRKVNFRLVSATNRTLETDVRDGRFREDLYYRIQVYPLVVPPLRDRPEDIPAIAVHHLAIIGKRENLRLRLTADAVEKLVTYAWPGNVRELVNTLERAALLADNGTIVAEHIVISSAGSTRLAAASLAPYRTAKAQFESAYYSQLLRTANGNISLAAKIAQKTRKEIYDAIKRLELDREIAPTDETS